MNEKKDESKMGDVFELAEEIVKDRFQHVSQKSSVMVLLLNLSIERLSRDMAEMPDIDRRKLKEPAFQPEPTGRGEAITLEPMALLLKEIKLPALPQILLELLRVINDPETSANDLAEIIRLDTSLSSYLLRLVNSAYYSFPFPIDTIQRAVTLIGTREISLIAFSSSFLNMFKQSTIDFIRIEDFWKHSISCGILARECARHCGMGNPERHFVAGLLHDIGRLAVFSNIPNLAQRVLAKSVENSSLLYEAEKEVMGFDHARFGGSLVGKWNFPSTLVAAAQHHHSPQLAKDFDEPKIIHIADIITHALGMGKSGESYVPPLDETVWTGLGISVSEVKQIIEKLDEEIESTMELLMGAGKTQ